VRARARGPKRATADKPRGLSGEATLSLVRGAERTVAEPGTRPAVAAIPSLSCGAGRVTGATSAGRPAPGDQKQATNHRGLRGQPTKRRDGVRAPDRGRDRAPWRRPPRSRARGDAAGARGATVLADAAARVTARGLAREPWRGVRAGATRARQPSRRCTRRDREVRRGLSASRCQRGRCRSYSGAPAWRAWAASRSARGGG
jgi:hypothetical protein